MRRKEENEVGKPLEQSTGREIGGMEARIEESNGEKGGEWSGTACQRKMERQGLGTEGNNGEMQRQARMRGE